MSDDNKKTIYMIDWLNAELSKRGHKNFRWAKPEDVLPHFQVIRNALVHDVTWSADTPLPLRDAAGKVVPLHLAVERDEAMPIRPIKGNVAVTLRASGTLTSRPSKIAKSPVYVYASHPDDDHSEKCGGSVPPPPRRIALPPGYMMERVIRSVFFFARTTPRMFEEVLADYQHDMLKAEAHGATAAALWRLRVKYWGALIWMLVGELPADVLGKILGKVIRGITGG